MAINRSLVVEDHRESMMERDFIITQLTNTVRWIIGDELTKDEVQGIISQGYNVVIKPRS